MQWGNDLKELEYQDRLIHSSDPSIIHTADDQKFYQDKTLHQQYVYLPTSQKNYFKKYLNI